ncbi:MAG TPA: chemotaxis response regulator protein-glutamate methylesterase [Acetobacteraceae bacterium]
MAPIATTEAAVPARVLVCDDSAVVRAALSRVLEAEHGIQVVARVANGRQAIEAVRRTAVDIVLLDIEMPLMDGLTALPLLLASDPRLRVIMASTSTTRMADATMRALQLGAADYIAKPSALVGLGNEAFRRELLSKVRGLVRTAESMPRALSARRLRPASGKRPELLAVGCSTGGPQALFTLVQGLAGGLSVPMLVTQHMPPAFTITLAAHLERLSGLPCAEAVDGETLIPGSILIAPGDRHLTVEAGSAGLCVRLLNGPAVNYCCPAVDPMLESAAAACGDRVLVAILTGMGHDGLAGTRRVVEAGGTAIAQDEATSVVWGMPGAVVQAGLCHAVLPLPEIAPKLLALLDTAAGGAVRNEWPLRDGRLP